MELGHVGAGSFLRKRWAEGSLEDQIRLTRVYSTEIAALKEYVEDLYRLDDDYDSMVNIEQGVASLLKNEQLATPFFILDAGKRIGYVILTRYHSVEKGGLTIYIDELYVEEAHRRQGTGSAILKQIVEIARAEGAKALWAQAEPYNTAAESFFLDQGFRPNTNKNFEMGL